MLRSPSRIQVKFEEGDDGDTEEDGEAVDGYARGEITAIVILAAHDAAGHVSDINRYKARFIDIYNKVGNPLVGKRNLLNLNQITFSK